MTDKLDETNNTEIEKTPIQLQHEVEELSDRLLRTMAESENMRKRFEKQLEDTSHFSISNLAKDIIGVIDNLERALSFEQANTSEDAKKILEGVKLTHKELMTALEKHEIKTINPEIGENFDYNQHFAISQVESDANANSIVGVMQVGYKIKDRLLRPAAVSVAKEKN
jgi:molecular chaperone GrpE